MSFGILLHRMSQQPMHRLPGRMSISIPLAQQQMVEEADSILRGGESIMQTVGPELTIQMATLLPLP